MGGRSYAVRQLYYVAFSGEGGQQGGIRERGRNPFSAKRPRQEQEEQVYT